MRFAQSFLLALLLSPWGAAGGELFTTGTIEQGLAEAKTAGKLVLVHFHSEQNDLSQVLQKVSWTDPDITAWIQAHAVPVKVDVDTPEGKAAAEQRNVKFIPSVLFLQSDGSVFDRLTGYTPKDKLMPILEGIAAGKNALARARDACEKKPNDPALKHQYGILLCQAGKYDDGAPLLFWCLDKGIEADPNYAVIRNSGLLKDIRAMVAGHSELGAQLAERVATARKSIMLAKEPKEQDVAFLVGLGQVEKNQDAMVKLYDLLKLSNPGNPNVLIMARYLSGPLVDQRRYEELRFIADEPDDFEQRIKEVDQALDQAAPELRAILKPRQEEERARLLLSYGLRYQVLEALGAEAKAADLAQRILEYEDSPEVRNMLAWNGYLSGKSTGRDLELSRSAIANFSAKNVDLVDTLARLMGQQGQSEAAVKMLEEEKAHFTDKQDMETIQRCLADLKKKP